MHIPHFCHFALFFFKILLLFEFFTFLIASTLIMEKAGPKGPAASSHLSLSLDLIKLIIHGFVQDLDVGSLHAG
jgi:hypothetical protein